MKESQPRKKSWKSIFVISALIGSLYLGDKCEPFKQITEKSFYHNSSIEDGYYQKPFDLEIITTRNEKNRVEVYLIDNSKHDSLPIRENMYVGTTGKSIDNFIDDKKENAKNWWQRQLSDSTGVLYKLNKKF
jgi:hypothetical protein